MDINDVITQERNLVFSEFTSDLALTIANEINKFVKENYNDPVAIKIYYEGKEILKFLMEGRKKSPWLERKNTTVLESEHSSLFVYFKRNENDYQSWIEDETYAICGGGFPIKIGGKIKGAISVSGLDHLSDHRVIVEVLKKILHKESIEE